MDHRPSLHRRALDFPTDYIHGYLGFIIRVYFIITARLTIQRHSPIPRSGYVLASNHRSFLDPLIIGCTLRRRIHYFARSSLWAIAPIRWTLNLFGGIPVDRDKPQAATVSHTVTVLREGRVLLMFPEGTRTRSGRLGRFREGPALVARRAKVPVLPIYLHRSESHWPRGAPLPIPGRGKVRVIFGPPMRPNSQLSPRQQDEELSQRIEQWLLATEHHLMGPAPRSRP